MLLFVRIIFQFISLYFLCVKILGEKTFSGGDFTEPKWIRRNCAERSGDWQAERRRRRQDPECDGAAPTGPGDTPEIRAGGKAVAQLPEHALQAAALQRAASWPGHLCEDPGCQAGRPKGTANSWIINVLTLIWRAPSFVLEQFSQETFYDRSDQCCPGSESFSSRIQRQKDSRIRIKELKNFNSKNCF